MSSSPVGDLGDPLGSSTGDPSFSPAMIGDLGRAVAASRAGASVVMPEWFVNAGDKGDCVWFPVFGMDQLVVDATPIKGSWPTSLVIKIEQAANRIVSRAFASPGPYSLSASTISVGITITGVPLVRIYIDTAGTSGEFVRVNATATKTITA